MVRKARRKILFKRKLHSDKVMFEKSYGYIKQYYPSGHVQTYRMSKASNGP